MRAIILLVIIGTAMAVPKTGNRIVGGSATSIEEYPYMANMQYGWWGVQWRQVCGGSLITSTSVLSVARCYFMDRPTDWRVILGSSRASSGGTQHIVAQLIIHEGFTGYLLDNNVAIVRLATPAIFSNTIQVARLPGSNYNLLDGTAVTAIGWGALWSAGPSSEQLLHVDVNIINQQLCAERYADLKAQPGYELWPDITDGMLCAGILDVGGKDSCTGDYGGPLVHQKDIVVGITSWGHNCADAFYPGVYVRASQYTSWISANA